MLRFLILTNDIRNHHTEFEIGNYNMPESKTSLHLKFKYWRSGNDQRVGLLFTRYQTYKWMITKSLKALLLKIKAIFTRSITSNSLSKRERKREMVRQWEKNSNQISFCTDTVTKEYDMVDIKKSRFIYDLEFFNGIS